MLRNFLFGLMILVVCLEELKAQEVEANDSPSPSVPSKKGPSRFSGMGGAMGGGGGGDGYSITWLPVQHVKGQMARLEAVQQRLGFTCPIWMNEGDIFAARVNLGWEHFNTSAVLPDSRRTFPEDLYNIDLGLLGVHRFDNGWSAMAMLSVGSASDHPFANIKTLNVMVMGFVNVPAGDRDSWKFGVMYSPLGQLQFPLPIIGYSWNPDDALSVNLGLPLSVTYKPTPEWTLEASYMILTTIHTQVSYLITPNVKLYGAYDWSNTGYYLRDTADTKDSRTERFRYYEMRLKGGMQLTILQKCNLDLGGGYAFDRHYNQGGVGISGTDNVRIGAGPFLTGQLSLKW